MLFSNPFAGSRRVHIWCVAWQVWLAALLIVPAANATQVFHSPGDDGAPAAGAPTIQSGGVQSVFLYIDGGALASTSGSQCRDGQGDEVCGFSLTLTGLDGLTITGFNADGGADLLVNQSSGSIVINGLDPVSPTPGPQRIGELLVNAIVDGSVELSSGEVIGADLGSETLTAETVVSVPEPAGLMGLASGVSLLSALAARRARRC